MGKQVIFYATPTDMEGVLQLAFSKGAIVFNDRGEQLDFRSVMELTQACFAGEVYGCNLFFSLEGLQIDMIDNENGRYIDLIKSEAIVFNPCTQQPEYILDQSSVDEQFQKGGFTVIDDVEKYNQLMAELLENPVYKKNPAYFDFGFNHARFYLKPAYFDDNAEKVKKDERISKLYAVLQNHIRKNFKMSQDRFGYIGADAYAHSLLGDFVPCSGKTVIQF